MDASMPMPDDSGEKDLLDTDTDIPVKLDSLEADGTRPEVGDQVSVKIDGTVSSIENDCAYVKCDKINDTDLEQILAEHGNQGDEDDQMAQMAQNADRSGTPLGGGDSYG